MFTSMFSTFLCQYHINLSSMIYFNYFVILEIDTNYTVGTDLNYLSPLPVFESRPGHVGKLPVTWG